MEHIRKSILRMVIFCIAVILVLQCALRSSVEISRTPSISSWLKFADLENVMKEGLGQQISSRPRIALLVVIEADTMLEFYEHAMLSIACYARIWNYDFRIANSSDYRNECIHKDKFFRRHCVAARILDSYDYILFLDADIGVVNPKKRIEDFLDADAEVIFYDRFYNWEVMAGAYLAKNTNWTKHFLNGFANYEFRLPASFHGTDNGALHAYLAEVILGDNHPGLEPCLHVYSKSRNFDDLFMYEACIRKLLGNKTHFRPIKILPKGTGWARDNWMTNNLWSPDRDFMMHNWKLTQLRIYRSIPLPLEARSNSEWYNPLAGRIELFRCTSGNTSWSYDKNLIATREVIDKRLDEFAADVEKQRTAALARLSEYMTKITN